MIVILIKTLTSGEGNTLETPRSEFGCRINIVVGGGQYRHPCRPLRSPTKQVSLNLSRVCAGEVLYQRRVIILSVGVWFRLTVYTRGSIKPRPEPCPMYEVYTSVAALLCRS